MFFLWLIIILILFAILILTLTIKIEVENLILNLSRVKDRVINQDYKVKLKIYLINKIRVVCIDVSKLNIKPRKINEQIKKFEQKLEKDKFKFDLSFIDDLKKLKIKLEKMDLKVYFGVEDAAITAILIGVISIIFGNLINNKMDNLEEQKYIINPIYQNRNVLNVKFDGIIVINMRNIISIILKIIGKRRVKKNGRASYRRTYVYSDE